MDSSSSSFTPFAQLYSDAKRVETKGATCDCYTVRRHGKLLFVKRLKPRLAADPRYVAAMQKEFEVGYNLDHPNIARYEAHGNDYVVLDYVDGRTLREAIDSDPKYFAIRKNLDKLVGQLLSAVGYLHSRGVLHLDLKPDNIMLTSVANDVKVLDLGFCYTDTYADTMGRTDKYAAPEQTDGSGRVDVRTDIYALGRLLQQLPRLPRIYNNVAKRCTQADKERRFQSVGEMEKYIRSRRSRRLWPVLLVVGLVAVAALVAAAIVSKPREANVETVVHDTVYISAPATVTPQVSNQASPMAEPAPKPTAADTLQRFRAELSTAIQKVYKRTLATYTDSSFDCSFTEAFNAKKQELKTHSHEIAQRLAKKYPTVDKDRVEQMWYTEVNGILGSVGMAMVRNDGK